MGGCFWLCLVWLADGSVVVCFANSFPCLFACLFAGLVCFVCWLAGVPACLFAGSCVFCVLVFACLVGGLVDWWVSLFRFATWISSYWESCVNEFCFVLFY